MSQAQTVYELVITSYKIHAKYSNPIELNICIEHSNPIFQGILPKGPYLPCLLDLWHVQSYDLNGWLESQFEQKHISQDLNSELIIYVWTGFPSSQAVNMKDGQYFMCLRRLTT